MLTHLYTSLWLPLCRYLVTHLLTQSGLDPTTDFLVTDPTFYSDLVLSQSLGLGEGFVQGKWTTPDLVSVIQKLSSSTTVNVLRYLLSFLYPLTLLKSCFSALFGQTRAQARQVGSQHYDLPLAHYEQMLGSPLIYSCGYWKDVDSLEEAQLQKMDLLCRKLQLQTGDRVLEIGCGWGDFAIYMAMNYQVTVVGLTISEGQRSVAEERAMTAGVAHRVTFLLQDYRDHTTTYDKVVSVGMLEHVSIGMLPTYFKTVERLLREEDGIAVIHSITKKGSSSDADPWINRYIFPNSAIPSYYSWVNALDGIGLEIEDVQNLGPDYAKTLHVWYDRFVSLCEKESEEMGRVWQYYLQACEAQFLSRHLNVWQMVLSKGRAERYDGVR